MIRMTNVFGLAALPTACSGSESTEPGNASAAGARAGASSNAGGGGAVSGGMSTSHSLHPNTEGLQAIADAVHFELFK